MEWKNLYGFVLLVILVGMLIGVGALALDKFGQAAKNTVAESETITISSSAGTTANDEVQSVVAFYNSSDSYTIDNEVNWTAAGGVTVAGFIDDEDYTINYSYLQDSVATTASGNSRTEVAAIASNWLGLIVTIAILAIIMGLVISGFATGRR